MRRATSWIAPRCLGCAMLCARSFVLAPTMIVRKDVRRRDGGESRRLSFDERAERRTPKTREQKQAREAIMLEAEQYVATEFPEELERIFEKCHEKCSMLALKVINLAKCLERLEIEVPGNKKLLLLQCAQVVKTKPNEYEIVPQSATTASPILNRVTRFDGTLQVVKEQQKIRVVVPPMTTARRDRAAADIRHAIVDFRNRLKIARQTASKFILQLSLDENLIREHNENLDSIANDFVDSKAQELEVMAEEVMTMGVDESDASLSS